MKLVGLRAENFKRLKLVELRIDPTKNTLVVSGENGAGKTSLLDSIEALFAGARAAPAVPVRRGAEKGEIRAEVLDVGEEYAVTRRFIGEKTELEIRAKDGAKYPGPQALLDSWFGKLSFDPLAFMAMEPKDQVKTLQRLTGVDLSKVDAKRKGAFDDRTVVNREIARAEAQLQAIPEVKIDTAAPLLEPAREALLKAVGVRGENDKHRILLDKAKAKEREGQESAVRIRGLIEEGKRKIQELEQNLVMAEDAWQVAKTARQKAEVVVAGLRDPDLTELRKQAEAAEAADSLRHKAAEKDALRALVGEKQKEAQALTAKVEECDRLKAATISSAKLPVKGLSYTDDGVLLNELPLEQASQAEKIRVSMAMALAMHPKLKLVLIRDASLLSPTSLELVTRMAKEADAQVILEMVNPGPIGVVIEDGEVAAVDGKRQAPRDQAREGWE